MHQCETCSIHTALETRQVILNVKQWCLNYCTMAFLTVVRLLIWIRQNLAIPANDTHNSYAGKQELNMYEKSRKLENTEEGKDESGVITI